MQGMEIFTPIEYGSVDNMENTENMENMEDTESMENTENMKNIEKLPLTWIVLYQKLVWFYLFYLFRAFSKFRGFISTTLILLTQFANAFACSLQILESGDEPWL